MISTFDFPDGEILQRQALVCAHRIDELRSRAKRFAVPIILVNDNYGHWRNDFQATVAAAAKSRLGREIAGILAPRDDDYHVLKPQRSGFFATPLEVLLSGLKVSDLIVTGVTTDICVMFTAHDAYMRGYSVRVPADCCAAVDKEHHAATLAMLERIADADTSTAEQIEFGVSTSGRKSLSR